MGAAVWADVAGSAQMILAAVILAERGFKGLKYNQNKNDATQLKNFLGLTLPPFFLHLHGEGKKGGNFKTKKFFN